MSETAEKTRHSGILMSVSSLPSPYGIGTLGRAAYEFADFLSAAGQFYWQMLPLGPTSYGDSPYQSFSTFAGNPYFVDLDMLCEEGLLTPAELNSCSWGDDPGQTDYGIIYGQRFRILRLAYERGIGNSRERLAAFAGANPWLDNYALFMAIKKKYNMVSWLEWPKAVRRREPDIINLLRAELAEDIEFYSYIQLLFFEQWNKLREYLHAKNIRVIGDIPIYVSMDSADVWSEPEQFYFDKDLMPIDVAGVPPDFFTEKGQLWGNPLYDWEHMKADGYGWWIRRIDGATKLYDALRMDHFMGLDKYWAVPAGAPDAIKGQWRSGPGPEFTKMLSSWFCGTKFIAEDLGFKTESLTKLIADSGWPGMKVLSFAFESGCDSEHLPYYHAVNSVCYTGTHDNDTALGWYDSAKEEDKVFACRYIGAQGRADFTRKYICAGMGSVADTFIAPMQDWLELDGSARMNMPGRPYGNWRWRMRPGAATPALAEEILGLTQLYGR